MYCYWSLSSLRGQGRTRAVFCVETEDYYNEANGGEDNSDEDYDCEDEEDNDEMFVVIGL